MRKATPIILMAMMGLSLLSCQRTPLQDRLVAEDTTTRAKALSKLVRLSDEKKSALIPLLIQHFKDPDNRLADRARRAMIAMGPISVEPLAQTLKDPDVYARMSAASALGQMGAEAAPAVTSLTAALTDQHPLVREESAHALGEIGEPAAAASAALLLASKKDSSEEVRATAAVALKKVSLPVKAS